MADWLGYAALLAVLATFLMRTMRLLRLVAILSNILFVAYGYIDHIQPIFLLHLALLPINLWRLVVHWNDARPQAPRRSVARRRSTTSPYALWFAVGVSRDGGRVFPVSDACIWVVGGGPVPF